MKKLTITAIAIIALFNSSLAQLIDYDFSIQYQSKAKQYWEVYNKYRYSDNGDTLKKYLLKIEPLIEPMTEHYVLMLYAYHLNKDYKNAVKTYYKAVSKGYLPYNENTQPFVFKENDSVIEYKKVLGQLDSLKKNINCAMDIPFCNLVVALVETDQMTRRADFFNAVDKSPGTKFNIEGYFPFYDHQNLTRLLSHIDQYGIPHQNSMTVEAYEAFLILVHHLVQYTDSSENKRLFTLVRKAIEDGRLQSKFLKAAIDYMHWRNNGQYFGTVAKRNKDGKYEMNPPIIDPANVDKRRAEWLFEPLEVQMKNSYGENIVLPTGYVSAVRDVPIPKHR